MKVVYIAETSLTNKSAYTQHVIKMCDAFAQLNHDLKFLYLPKIHKNFDFEVIMDKFLLLSNNRFRLRSLINLKLTNIFYKFFLRFL